MRITTVHYSKTLSDGNYGNDRMGMTADVGDDDDVRGVSRRLQALVWNELQHAQHGCIDDVEPIEIDVHDHGDAYDEASDPDATFIPDAVPASIGGTDNTNARVVAAPAFATVEIDERDFAARDRAIVEHVAAAPYFVTVDSAGYNALVQRVVDLEADVASARSLADSEAQARIDAEDAYADLNRTYESTRRDADKRIGAGNMQYNTLAKERDELRVQYTSLAVERDELQSRASSFQKVRSVLEARIEELKTQVLDGQAANEQLRLDAVDARATTTQVLDERDQYRAQRAVARDAESALVLELRTNLQYERAAVERLREEADRLRVVALDAEKKTRDALDVTAELRALNAKLVAQIEQRDKTILDLQHHNVQALGGGAS